MVRRRKESMKGNVQKYRKDSSGKKLAKQLQVGYGKVLSKDPCDDKTLKSFVVKSSEHNIKVIELLFAYLNFVKDKGRRKQSVRINILGAHDPFIVRDYDGAVSSFDSQGNFSVPPEPLLPGTNVPTVVDDGYGLFNKNGELELWLL